VFERRRQREIGEKRMAVLLIVLGAVLLLGAIAVILAAIFPPKEWKPWAKSTWDDSLEDV